MRGIWGISNREKFPGWNRGRNGGWGRGTVVSVHIFLTR